MKVIQTLKAPSAIGPYSQAIITDSFVYSSGQIAINPETGNIVDGDIALQTEQVCKNIGAILDAAGSSFDKVVKTTCFLTNIKDFATFNSVYEKYFVSKPARSCVEVGALPKSALCEIEVIAEV